MGVRLSSAVVACSPSASVRSSRAVGCGGLRLCSIEALGHSAEGKCSSSGLSATDVLLSQFVVRKKVNRVLVLLKGNVFHTDVYGLFRLVLNEQKTSDCLPRLFSISDSHLNHIVIRLLLLDYPAL